jgi:PQQ-dependent catabolism-associated beta-propeller protein
MTRAAMLAAVLLAVAVPAWADTVYVSDEVANVLHVVDGESGRLLGQVAVGKRPRGMALSHDGKQLYVAAGEDDRIDVVDLATRKVVDHLPSGPDPERFVVSPDGRRLYIADEDDSQVAFVDIASKTITARIDVGGEPEGMAVSPDGKWVICTSEAASLAHFIDADKAVLVDSLMVGARPRDARFTPDGRELWVSSEQRATVSVIDPASRKLLRTIDFEKESPPENVQAVQMTMTRDGATAYVALGRGNHVARIDVKSGKVGPYYTAGFRTWNLALSPDERRVYAANGLSGDLSLIDLKTGQSRTVKLEGRPWGVIATP